MYSQSTRGKRSSTRTRSVAAQPKIAIVRLSAIGDLVLCSAAVHRLSQQLPNARITWLTSGLSAQLFTDLQHVTLKPIAKPQRLSDYRRFYHAMRPYTFNTLLAMQASLRINLLYPLIRAKQKIGFDPKRGRDAQRLFIHHTINYENNHILDGFLQFITHSFDEHDLQPLPINRPEVKPLVWPITPPAANLNWAKSIVAQGSPCICINSCASKTERNWPIERFQALIQALLHAYPQALILLTGGHDAIEQQRAHTLMKGCGNHPAVQNWVGQTHLLQLAALLQQCDVLVAPDTGPVHLARAMNTPVVGLYAIARPQLTGPYQRLEYCVDAYPKAVEQYLNKGLHEVQWHTRVHHRQAMSLIQVSSVLQQVDRALNCKKQA